MLAGNSFNYVYFSQKDLNRKSQLHCVSGQIYVDCLVIVYIYIDLWQIFFMVIVYSVIYWVNFLSKRYES